MNLLFVGDRQNKVIIQEYVKKYILFGYSVEYMITEDILDERDILAKVGKADRVFAINDKVKKSIDIVKCYSDKIEVIHLLNVDIEGLKDLHEESLVIGGEQRPYIIKSGSLGGQCHIAEFDDIEVWEHIELLRKAENRPQYVILSGFTYKEVQNVMSKLYLVQILWTESNVLYGATKFTRKYLGRLHQLAICDNKDDNIDD